MEASDVPPLLAVAVVEALPLGVLVWRAEGEEPGSLRLLAASGVAEDQAGLALRAGVGLQADELFEGAHAWCEPVHAAAVAQESAIFEREHHPPEHLPARYRVWVRPLGDRRVAVYHEDITDVQDQRRALEESERLNRSIVSSLQEGVVVADADGTIRQVNAAVSEVCGADVHALVGGPLLGLPIEVLHPDGTRIPLEEIPISRALAGAHVRGALLRLRRRDATEVWIEVNASPLEGEPGEGPAGAVSTLVDVTRRIERERRVRHEADHDPLTGLANRRTLDRALEVAVDRARRDGHGVAALVADLDGFKSINDRFGHAAGDEALREIARRLREAVRDRDLVSRLGGDEFVLVLNDLAGSDGLAEDLRTRVEGVLRLPVHVAGAELPLNAAVGLACFPQDAPDARALLEAADRAMYLRKRAA